MVIKAVRSRINPKLWEVEIRQEHQSFRLNYCGDKDGAVWYTKMFRVALKRHTIKAKLREIKDILEKLKS